MQLRPLKTNKLPDPPASFLKLVGPSIIFIGLALGSGELIMWPYLVSNWGLGIIWGALLGITMQYFLNIEIERYALANGESIFVGFARLFSKLPYWFILSTVIAWSWPGFASASAQILTFFGLQDAWWVAILILILTGVILTLGPALYKTVETVEKVLVMISVPSILLIAFAVVKGTDVQMLLQGLVGIGEGYFIFPDSKEFPYANFLAALAYAGAGGNLLLAQSFYIKEKGYGMGKYAGKITSLITGKDEHVELEGSTFERTPEEISKFKVWFKMASREHLVVFWGMGLFTMLLLALISYASSYGQSGNAIGIQFLFTQANMINTLFPIPLGSFLLVITAVMLFSTQLTVIDAAGRIIAENIALLKTPNLSGRSVPKFYYLSIWIIILFGIAVLLAGYTEPQFLLVTGAIINAVCMFFFSGILIATNVRFLPKEIHPSLLKKLIVYAIFVIMGLFSAYVIAEKLGIF